MNQFRLAEIPRIPSCPEIHQFTPEAAKTVAAYHRSFPGYAPTPLKSLSALSEALGVSGIYIKDESHRFGLNAFKALGGSYAIGQYLAKKLGVSPEEITFALLIAPETRELLGDVTFCTATDGNHGRGVAWTANKLGQGCVVYMPKGSAEERVRNIEKLGAQVIVTDMPYDDTVRLARETAEKNGWITVQDTAWQGYQEIPLHVMQGYMTMAHEAFCQMNQEAPTHIFLQAGVGSMAGAVAGLMKLLCCPAEPTVIVVEPHNADCHFRSALAGDGSIRTTPGDLQTIMAGLACGEPNPLSWNILRCAAHFCLSVPEYTAADGMRVLSSPIGTDEKIISGESGASGFGAFYEIMTRSSLASVRERIGLNASSRVLFFSTEGATDPINYRKVVWEGAYSAPEA